MALCALGIALGTIDSAKLLTKENDKHSKRTASKSKGTLCNPHVSSGRMDITKSGNTFSGNADIVNITGQGGSTSSNVHNGRPSTRSTHLNGASSVRCRLASSRQEETATTGLECFRLHSDSSLQPNLSRSSFSREPVCDEPTSKDDRKSSRISFCSQIISREIKRLSTRKTTKKKIPSQTVSLELQFRKFLSEKKIERNLHSEKNEVKDYLRNVSFNAIGSLRPHKLYYPKPLTVLGITSALNKSTRNVTSMGTCFSKAMKRSNDYQKTAKWEGTMRKSWTSSSRAVDTNSTQKAGAVSRCGESSIKSTNADAQKNEVYSCNAMSETETSTQSAGDMLKTEDDNNFVNVGNDSVASENEFTPQSGIYRYGTMSAKQRDKALRDNTLERDEILTRQPEDAKELKNFHLSETNQHTVRSVLNLRCRFVRRQYEPRNESKHYMVGRCFEKIRGRSMMDGYIGLHKDYATPTIQQPTVDDVNSTSRTDGMASAFEIHDAISASRINPMVHLASGTIYSTRDCMHMEFDNAASKSGIHDTTTASRVDDKISTSFNDNAQELDAKTSTETYFLQQAGSTMPAYVYDTTPLSQRFTDARDATVAAGTREYAQIMAEIEVNRNASATNAQDHVKFAAGPKTASSHNMALEAEAGKREVGKGDGEGEAAMVDEEYEKWEEAHKEERNWVERTSMRWRPPEDAEYAMQLSEWHVYGLRTGHLPWWLIILAYPITVGAAGFGAYLLIINSIYITYQMAVDWVVSFVTAWAFTAIVLYPLMIVLVALLFVRKKNYVDAYQYSKVKLLDADDNFKFEQEIAELARRNLSDKTMKKKREYPFPITKKQVSEMMLNLEQQTQAQLAVHEVFLYTFFLIFVTLACVGRVSVEELHRANANAKAMFEEARFHGGVLKLSEVKKIEHIWGYTLGTLLDTMYAGCAKGASEEDNCLSTSNRVSYVLGVARMRQVRQRAVTESCLEAPGGSEYAQSLHPKNEMCLTAFTEDDHDSATYRYNWGTALGQVNESSLARDKILYGKLDPWKFRTADQLKELTKWGFFGTYTGGGYTFDIPNKNTLARSYLSQLQYLKWIDKYSRAIFVDLVLYNPNRDLITSVTIVFENTVFGELQAYVTTLTTKLRFYRTALDLLVGACEVGFIAMVAAYAYFETLQLMDVGWKEYLTSPGGYLQWLISVLSIIGIRLHFQRLFLVDQYIDALAEKDGLVEHVSFNYARDMENQMLTAKGVIYGLVIFSLFRVIRLNPYFQIMLKTFSLASTELINFSLVGIILIFSLSSIVHLSFGSRLTWYNSLWGTYISMVGFAMGVSKLFKVGDNESEMFWPTFAFIVVYVVSVLVVSFTIAILLEAFNVTRIAENFSKEEAYIYNYVRKKVYTFLNMEDRLKASNRLQPRSKQDADKTEKDNSSGPVDSKTDITSKVLRLSSAFKSAVRRSHSGSDFSDDEEAAEGLETSEMSGPEGYEMSDVPEGSTVSENLAQASEEPGLQIHKQGKERKGTKKPRNSDDSPTEKRKRKVSRHLLSMPGKPKRSQKREKSRRYKEQESSRHSKSPVNDRVPIVQDSATSSLGSYVQMQVYSDEDEFSRNSTDPGTPPISGPSSDLLQGGIVRDERHPDTRF